MYPFSLKVIPYCSNVNLFIFLLFSKDDRSIYLSICDTLLSTIITILRLNKTCSPTLDHFQLVNVLAQVGSQTELEYSSLDRIREM